MLYTDSKANNTLNGENPLVFNFKDIFDAWVSGKCTTNYLMKHINEIVSESFVKELQRIGGNK